MIFRGLCILLLGLIVSSALAQDSADLRATFRVRYIAEGGIYLEGGRNHGLAEGTKLVIKQSTTTTPGAPAEGTAEPGVVAQLVVVSVAATSAVCEVISSARQIVAGDVAVLPESEVEELIKKHSLSSTRQYPVSVSFTGDDPLDEELRNAVPRPPLPEVNRATGRIGFDFSATRGQVTSSAFGVVLRADITRIKGTYWNVNGYWRGQIISTSAPSQPTMQDLLNRTYHLSLTYTNPNSRWVAGIGRMYLPWASSLQTIDGGYLGRRTSDRTTIGTFAGSTPDPTSWSYNPNRRLGGGFVNFEGGSYDELHYSSTIGLGVSILGWQIDRPFLFTENTFSYGRTFSLYHSLRVDRPRAAPGAPQVGVGVGSSYLTLHWQPQAKISFDLNHTYFRDVPTFVPQLLGLGLLDKILFQGFSGGVRVDLPKMVTFYSNIGRSDSSGDPKSAWNLMFGATRADLHHTGLRLDARCTKFNSVFAHGSYESISVARNFNLASWWTVQIGRQAFASPTLSDSSSYFLNGHVDLAFGARYFLEGGLTLQRGARVESYNQVYTTFGYRFDNRGNRKGEGNAVHK